MRDRHRCQFGNRRSRGTGAIKVIFDRSMTGMRGGGVKILSNDPIEREKTIVLRFEIVP